MVRAGAPYDRTVRSARIVTPRSLRRALRAVVVIGAVAGGDVSRADRGRRVLRRGDGMDVLEVPPQWRDAAGAVALEARWHRQAR